MTIQSKAENPPAIEKSSKEYTQTLVDEIQRLKSEKKKFNCSVRKKQLSMAYHKAFETRR